MLFFIPLGVSASLTSVTHVIINGTLSRGDNAAFIIACYAVAMSLFGIIERPIIIFRQTSSALVHDRKAFKILSRFFIYVLFTIMLISSIIADRKSTRLNSSHVSISYAVFCLKKKK